MSSSSGNSSSSSRVVALIVVVIVIVESAIVVVTVTVAVAVVVVTVVITLLNSHVPKTSTFQCFSPELPTSTSHPWLVQLSVPPSTRLDCEGKKQNYYFTLKYPT